MCMGKRVLRGGIRSMGCMWSEGGPRRGLRVGAQRLGGRISCCFMWISGARGEGK